MTSPKYRKIYAVVRGIPRGCVATYGQVAALAGLPGQSRLVGYALHQCGGEDEDVPWQRVVNARGEISLRSSQTGVESIQEKQLKKEGIRFDKAGRIDLERYRWEPDPGWTSPE